MSRRISKVLSGGEWMGQVRWETVALSGGSDLNWDGRDRKGARFRIGCSGTRTRA